MKELFRETIQSVQDKTFGRQIVQKPFSAAFWYWAKYVLIFTAIYFLIVVISATYQIPQLPKRVKENLPSGELAIKNGKLSSTLDPKTVFHSSEFTVTIDPQAIVEDPNSLPSGILITEDKVYFKSGDSPTQSTSLSDAPNMSLTREGISKWIEENQAKIWGVVIVAALIIGLLLTTMFIAMQLISMLIWSLIFWLVFKIMRRQIAYAKLMKLSLYASVPWLIVSNILNMTPNPIFTWLNTGLFIFFVVTWANNLTVKSAPIEQPKSEPRKRLAHKK